MIVADTDEVQAIFAGSALWLDCRPLVQPVDSLVQVSWYHDDELLYYQYVVNARAVSYPPNTTAGVMFHARASSQSVGHVTVWPVMPRDAGVYSCHVVMSTGDDVTDAERRKTTTVFVRESLFAFTFAPGLPSQVVKNGMPHSITVCDPAPGHLAPCMAEMAMLRWVQEGIATSRSGGPVRGITPENFLKF